MKLEPDELRSFRILVVDDEPANLTILGRLLNRSGYESVRTLSDSTEAVEVWREYQPDLLLLDLHMPRLDGFAILELLSSEIPRDMYFPILMLTGDLTQEVRERALLAGAMDFVTKPFDLTEVLLRIRNLLETRALHLQLQRHRETLEDRVRERTRELAGAQIEILHRLAIASEYRDDVTGRHAERVGLVASLLARELDHSEYEVRLMRRAATLHDVGKIGVPDNILRKPGPLTEEEFQIMRNHTEIGARILSGSRFPLMRMARTVALNHHEKWDGSGYSSGRSGEEIPMAGRIVAVADVFDSLTHERPYKRAFTFEEAVEILESDRGKHFDPQVLDAFMDLLRTGAFADLDAQVLNTISGEVMGDSSLASVLEVTSDHGADAPPIDLAD